MLKLLLLIWTLLAASAAVQCPDKGTCDKGETCCSSPNNGYQCCPFKQAECCEDHIHCCPSLTVCDQSSSSCINATASIPWMERTSAALPTTEASFWEDWLRTKQGNQKADEAKVENSAEFTIGLSTLSEKEILPSSLNSAAESSITNDNKVPCNATSYCPDGYTCCKKTDQEWACCPLAQAVCCADHLHCCPHGQRCNLKEQRCDAGQESVPWFEKMPAIQRKDVEVKYVPCDLSYVCPDGNTCCISPYGHWWCCPLPQAVCCSDNVHCCPYHHRCSPVRQTCDTNLESVPWFEKIPAIQRKDVEVKSISCNETAACPDRTTCCKLVDGEWGCCPLPQAVCCADHVHCCPHGKRCNVKQQRCETGLQSVPWFEKVPAIQRKDVEANSIEGSDEEEDEDDGKMEAEVQAWIKCDATSSCPALTTCCFTEDFHKYGCCPLPEAVCCSGSRSCCPKGYSCSEDGQCIQKARLDWSMWKMLLSEKQDPEFM